MPRMHLTPAERERGVRLGELLATERETAQLSQRLLADQSGVGVDTLRGIEQGRVAAPSFFIVAALAHELTVSLDSLASDIASGP